MATSSSVKLQPPIWQSESIAQIINTWPRNTTDQHLAINPPSGKWRLPHNHQEAIGSALSNKPIYGGPVCVLGFHKHMLNRPFLCAHQPPTNTVKVAMNQWNGT